MCGLSRGLSRALPAVLSIVFLSALRAQDDAAPVGDAAPAEVDDLATLASNVQIDSLETSYDQATGVASAVGDVKISYGDVEISSNDAQYHRTSGDIFANGDVTIYKDGILYRGESVIYNIQTGKITANHIRSGVGPMFYDAGEMTLESDEIDIIATTGTMFTTHDAENPNYRIKAKRIEIYPEDRIVFRNLTVYAGKVPVFWLPYLSQPFDEELGYSFTPGYASRWGTFLLNQYGFLVGDHTLAKLHLDLRSKRGIGTGIDLISMRHHDNPNFGQLRLYYASDSDASINFSSSLRPTTDPNRYLVGLQHRIYLPGPEESTLYLDVDLNITSDEFFWEDFYPAEYLVNPRPDNMINLVKQSDRAEL
ncbi:MAG: LptA/OstA family protein, partial [Verrucomicrobiales bacterium]